MARKAAVLMALLLLGGCGYKAGFLVRDDVEKISVPVFANDTFYRNLEIDLTNAVVERIEKETPYKIADAADADAVLEGRITRYGVTVLQEKTDRQKPADNGINRITTTTDAEAVLTVEVTLKDTHSGKVLAKATIRDGESFSTFAGESELGSRALLFRRVAQEIVEKSLEKDW
jgi:hypothetical protein